MLAKQHGFCPWMVRNLLRHQGCGGWILKRWISNPNHVQSTQSTCCRRRIELQPGFQSCAWDRGGRKRSKETAWQVSVPSPSFPSSSFDGRLLSSPTAKLAKAIKDLFQVHRVSCWQSAPHVETDQVSESREKVTVLRKAVAEAS